MNFDTELPMHIPTRSGMLTVATYNVRLEIAPDCVGDGSWYVESVSVWGQYGSESSAWHELQKEHEIARVTTRLAYSDWTTTISDKWSEHRWNNPPLRRRPGLRVIGGRED